MGILFSGSRFNGLKKFPIEWFLTFLNFNGVQKTAIGSRHAVWRFYGIFFAYYSEMIEAGVELSLLMHFC